MTVGEALELTDRRFPNLYSREEKLAWDVMSQEVA